MPRIIPIEELRLLQEVDRLGERGLNQSEAAASLGMPLPTLRSKVERHGLELVNAVQVRAKIGGKRISDLASGGEVGVADDTVLVPEAQQEPVPA